MKKTIAVALTFLVFLLLFGGCVSKQESYALKVNGKEIPRERYEKKLESVKNYFSAQGIDFESEEGRANLKNIQREVLEGLIGQELIKQEVEKQKWESADPEVEKLIAEFKKELGTQDYQEWLKSQGMTDEEVVNYYTFLVNVTRDVKVSEQEVKQYFEANYAAYGGQEEQVKARHILVKTEQEALDLIKILKQGQEDFAKLASEKSIEPAAKSTGGDLGYFGRGKMIAEFEEAAFSQPVGEISEKPVKTKYGYHIILVEDRKKAIKPDFDLHKDQVQKDALEFNKYQTLESYFVALRQQAKIEYAEDLQEVMK